MRIEKRVIGDARRVVALETTLLVHGVPAESAMDLHRELGSIVREAGAEPALVGVVDGVGVVGVRDAELEAMLERAAESPNAVPKVNSANMRVAAHMGRASSSTNYAATTVSATMELAAACGVRVFATGALGGVHRGYGSPTATGGCMLDVSSDLTALSKWPVAVVSAGVKGLLDVEGTREVLETLCVPVLGWRTDVFPAFYVRESGAGVDGRFDDLYAMARLCEASLTGGSGGIVIANPIQEQDAIPADSFADWLDQAEDEAEDAGVVGRSVTPFVLSRLHELSQGATLDANIALVRSNAQLAAELAVAMANAAAES